MQFKLVQYKENLYANFWTVPLAISILAILLAFGCLHLDHTNLLSGIKQYLNHFIIGDNSRTLLSIIASSVISITSVTFSITVLILSINSNQLGPRLLPNFMRQKSTQFVLGIFIGTFIYTLIIIHSMSLFTTYTNSPYLSVSVGLLLGIISFFALIYFIHFVCHVIQIDNVLTFLTEDLIRSLNNQLPDRLEAEEDIHQIISEKKKKSFKKNQYPSQTIIRSQKWGYIQTINYSDLLNYAEKNNIIIKVPYRIGDYILSSLPLFILYHEKDFHVYNENQYLSTIQIGTRRSTVQDIEYAFEQINEIAVRALSPGINTPYTAIHCLDRIFQGFVRLSNKMPLNRVVSNNEGSIRLIREISDYENIINATLDRFRQDGKNDLSVTIHFLRLITRILELKLPDNFKNSLIDQAKLIYHDVNKKNMNTKDKNDLDYFFNLIYVDN